MKKVMDGKVFDTETATPLGGFEKHGHKWDYGYVSETVFRSPGGQLFLHVCGRGVQHFWVGGSAGWSGREYLELMTESDISEWLEKHSSWITEETMEKFVAEFGFPAG